MKRIFYTVICFTLILSVLVGCATTRKPAPKPAPSKNAPPPKIDQTPKRPSPTTPRTPSPKPAPQQNNRTSQKLAKRLATSAEKIDGVKSATVVVSDSTAFIGLETNPDVEASETNKIKSKVTKKLKDEDKSLKDVSITTDPNLITRLKKVAKGVENGKPLSSFSKEIEEITRRMMPKTK